MKGTSGLQNVHYGPRSGGRIALGCDLNGARYHVWIIEESGMTDGPLYKNPPLKIKHGEPGHFRTRELRSTFKSSAQIIAAMREIATREGAMEKFEATEREKLVRTREELNASRAAQHVRIAAPELLEASKVALFEIVTALQDYTFSAEKSNALNKAKRGLEDAIAKAQHAPN